MSLHESVSRDEEARVAFASCCSEAVNYDTIAVFYQKEIMQERMLRDGPR